MALKDKAKKLNEDDIEKVSGGNIAEVPPLIAKEIELCAANIIKPNSSNNNQENK